MDYAAIRDGLKNRLLSIPGFVAVYDTAPDRVTPPAAAVLPGEPAVEYHTSMGGAAGNVARCEFDVIIFAGRFQSEAAQDTLDSFFLTVPAVLEADPTLGGAAEVVHVSSASNYGVVTVADTSFLGVRFVTDVYVRADFASVGGGPSGTPSFSDGFNIGFDVS